MGIALAIDLNLVDIGKYVKCPEFSVPISPSVCAFYPAQWSMPIVTEVSIDMAEPILTCPVGHVVKKGHPKTKKTGLNCYNYEPEASHMACDHPFVYSDDHNGCINYVFSTVQSACSNKSCPAYWKCEESNSEPFYDKDKDAWLCTTRIIEQGEWNGNASCRHGFSIRSVSYAGNVAVQCEKVFTYEAQKELRTGPVCPSHSMLVSTPFFNVGSKEKHATEPTFIIHLFDTFLWTELDDSIVELDGMDQITTTEEMMYDDSHFILLCKYDRFMRSYNSCSFGYTMRPNGLTCLPPKSLSPPVISCPDEYTLEIDEQGDYYQTGVCVRRSKSYTCNSNMVLSMQHKVCMKLDTIGALIPLTYDNPIFDDEKEIARSLIRETEVKKVLPFLYMLSGWVVQKNSDHFPIFDSEYPLAPFDSVLGRESAVIPHYHVHGSSVLTRHQ